MIDTDVRYEMKGRARVAVMLLVGLGFLSFGCDSGGGGGIGPIILITNQWREEGNPDHRFDLNSLDDDRSEGAFTGVEELERNGVTEFNNLAGFWSDGVIRFTIDRPEGPLRYTGEIDEDNVRRLEFTSSRGSLVIVRD